MFSHLLSHLYSLLSLLFCGANEPHSGSVSPCTHSHLYRTAINMHFFVCIIATNDWIFTSQVTFIYIALFTIQIVSKQLHSENMKVVQHRSIILLNIKCPQLSKPKARQQWQGTKTSSGDWMDAL